MTRNRDTLTSDMFLVPQQPAPVPASMNYGGEVAAVLAVMLAESGLDRFQIAAEMSRMTGREVSKYMLDAYTAESRDAYNMPFYLVPVAEFVCKSHSLSQWLADKRGARLAIGRDALNAEYGRMQSQIGELKKQMKTLEKMIGSTR